LSAKPDRAPRWLGNGNAGWSAEIQAADVKLTDAALRETMKVNVNYFGFRDGLKEDGKYQKAAFAAGPLVPGLLEHQRDVIRQEDRLHGGMMARAIGYACRGNGWVRDMASRTQPSSAREGRKAREQ
jgi:hypothetical protein